MATAKTTPKMIRLIYDFSNWKVTSEPKALRLQEGEKIAFTCSQGQLHLLLEPTDAYHPSEFRTGGDPVVVKRIAEGMFWCGGTFRDGSKTITINPSEKQYGLNPNLPPDPGGGS